MARPTREIVSKVYRISEHQPNVAWCAPGVELRAVPSVLKGEIYSIKLLVRGGLLRKTWRPLGELNLDLVYDLGPAVQRGLALRVLVAEVTGGRKKGRRYHGVNIVIQYDHAERKRIEAEIEQEFYRQKARTVRAATQAAEERENAAAAKRAASARAKERRRAGLRALLRMLGVVAGAIARCGRTIGRFGAEAAAELPEFVGSKPAEPPAAGPPSTPRSRP